MLGIDKNLIVPADGSITAAKLAPGVIPVPGVDLYSGGLYAQQGPQTTTGVWTLNAGTPTNTGTVSTPAGAAGSYRTEAARTRAETAATAGALAGIRGSTRGIIWRGNGVGRGGFRFTNPVSIGVLVAGNRGFSGVSNLLTAPTNVDPLTSTTGSKIGLAFALGTGNWKLIHNLAGSAPTTIDLGADFPLNTTDIFTLELKCLENASTVDWKVTRTGSSAVAEGVLTSNLPTNTTYLAPNFWMTNNATAALCAIESMGWKATSKNI